MHRLRAGARSVATQIIIIYKHVKTVCMKERDSKKKEYLKIA